MLRDAVVTVASDGRWRGVRPARADDGPAHEGLCVAGLVNAHTHLELSGLVGRVPGGEGFQAWASRSVRTRPDPTVPDGAARARELVDRWGTAVVHDVSNGGHTGPWLVAAGAQGVVHHEVLGRDPAQIARAGAVVAAGVVPVGRGVVRRPSPHALLSTDPELVADALAVGGPPGTLHVAETPDEERLLVAGEGPVADWLDRLGRRWRRGPPPGVDAVALLDRLGVLRRGLLLVHGIHLAPDALRRAARAGAVLTVCPRSNQHIEGRVADIARFVAAGGRVAVGTDSLASSPTLDVLDELPVLAEAVPEVPMETWLSAVTSEASAAWTGGAVGVLQLDIASPADLARGAPTRRWLARPGTV